MERWILQARKRPVRKSDGQGKTQWILLSGNEKVIQDKDVGTDEAMLILLQTECGDECVSDCTLFSNMWCDEILSSQYCPIVFLRDAKFVVTEFHITDVDDSVPPFDHYANLDAINRAVEWKTCSLHQRV